MLKQLSIRNFRMLSDFSVGSLGRVNLIVGRNNSGKSTVLEALRLLAEGGDSRFLLALLSEHDELAMSSSESDTERPEPSLSAIRHLFTNRSLPKDDETLISIGTDDGYRIQIEHIYFEIREVEHREESDGTVETRRIRVPVAKSDLGEFGPPLHEGIKVTRLDNLQPRSFVLDMSDKWYWRRPVVSDAALGKLPYGYIPTHFVPLDDLAGWWDQIVFTPQESRVIEALNFIEPNVEGLAFVKNPGGGRYSRTERRPERIPVVKLRGRVEPVPLSSMGDGMARVLQLILAMAPAKGGFLLVDEFENGLYFDVQENVWRLVFQLASELDIQVFATTHSRDCIESFARVSNDHPENGVLFKMAQSRLASDNYKVIATVYDEEQLALATETELEVR